MFSDFESTYVMHGTCKEHCFLKLSGWRGWGSILCQQRIIKKGQVCVSNVIADLLQCKLQTL